MITEKVEHYGSEILEITYAPDDLDIISEKILDLKAKGADVIFTTGGMSVDPDDLTPTAIKKAGADIVTYGASALPGAMFMMAYLDDTPILGVPAAVCFSGRLSSIFSFRESSQTKRLQGATLPASALAAFVCSATSAYGQSAHLESKFSDR